MNCMCCGTLLTSPDLEYCPHCGSNVQVQRKVEYLSRLYYNRGLEKAEIRDLSGAITFLKTSLMFDKNNIAARNLLGLVYFETGEVVEALSQWVISKNLRPTRKNLATEYIERLQANQGKLEIINDTIRKYNTALDLCRQGHEDMAAIQLKKILAQNPKLIKGYHLLALLQMKDHSWNKARRTLRKAVKIDKTNTTTLRFLKEIDQRTGVVTKVDNRNGDHQKRGMVFGKRHSGEEMAGRGDFVIQPPAYHEKSILGVVFWILGGFALGAAALWYLVLPTVKQGIYREANQQIMEYSDYLVWQEAELNSVKGELQVQSNTQDASQYQAQISAIQAKSNSYQALLSAYKALQDKQPKRAAEFIRLVKPSTLSQTALAIYYKISEETYEYGSEDLYTEEVVEDIEDTIAESTENSEDENELDIYGEPVDSEEYNYDTTGIYDDNSYNDYTYYDDYNVYDTGNDWNYWQ